MRQILRIGLTLSLLTAFFIFNGLGQVFITELADPDNNASARFVELYNAGSTSVDFSTGWQLQRATNGNTYWQSPVNLTGTIPAGGFYIVCNDQATFTSVYGFAPDQDMGGGGPADSNGDDQIRLLSPGTVVEDMFGVLGEDGTGTNHEFEDGRAERKATVTSGNVTYTFSEWNIWNDTGGAGTINDPQNAPGDFDPGSWIGTTASPVVSVSIATLNGFYYQYTYGPSGEQSFTVEGSNLTNDIVITPPTDYEISEGTGGSFVATNPITLTQSGGSVATTTIYVRLKAGLSAGDYNNEDITASSTGATSKTVTCNGSVLVPATTTIPYLEEFVSDLGDCYTFSVSGDTKEWYHNSGDEAAAMNGYNSGDVEEDWLILPGINLDNYSDELFTFDTWYNYGNDDINNFLKLFYSTDYSGLGDPSTATWVEMAFTHPSSSSTWTPSGDVDLSAISGSMVYIAFEYHYEPGNYRYWEIDNLSIIESSAIVEPTNHPTNFSATANSTTEITVGWTDSDAAHYLIKGSDVSYAAIADPVDGTPEADGALVQNIDAGVETFQFTGLTPSTQYFFKIFGYNGTGSAIDYKVTGAPQDDATTLTPLPPPNIWLNEIHYDNDGGDVGEFVEIVMEDASTYTLSEITVELYNGSGGTVYDSETLDNFTAGDSQNGYTIFTWYPSSIQNGPDAVAISYAGTLISGQFLSYEGTFMATDGYANSETSVDIGVSETTSTQIGESLQLANAGNLYNHFEWQDYAAETPGMVNNNQDIGNYTFWTGGVNNVWNNAGNWDDGIPTSSKNGAITDVSGSKAPSPVISGSATVLNLFMSTGSTLDIAGTGDLTVNGTFSNNGTLNIKSDATGTGSLIEYSGVNANVEQYLTPDKWHYVSSPVTSLVSDVFEGIYLMEWDEPSETWTFITQLGVTLNPTMYGYAAWQNTSATTVTFSGSLNTGSKSIGVTNNVDPVSDNSGFNFVGNPYPSGLDWDVDNGSGWTRNNVANSLYIWNQGVGNYGVYVKGSGGSGTNGVTNEIPPHQGFFVYCDDDAGPGAGSGTIGVDDPARIHTDQEILKNGEDIFDNLRFKVMGNNLSDEVMIFLNPDAGSGFDPQFDAKKLNGSDDAPQLFTYTSDQTRLSVNAIPNTTQNQKIAMGIDVGAQGTYTLALEDIEGFDGVPVYLEDLQENKVIDIKTFLVYKFNASPDDESMRFVLHFTYGETPSPVAGNDNDKFAVYQLNKKIIINSAKEITGTVKVFDMLGQEILAEHIQSATNHEMKALEKPGNYIVTIASDRGVYNEKLFIR